MKLRRLAAAFLCLLAVTGTCGAIGLMVDGQQLVLDVQPQVVQQRTLVPMRAIFEKLGATVTWDQATQTARAVKGSDTVEITLNSTTAYVNGEAEALDVPAMAMNGRTLVPVRFVSEALDAQVDWFQDSQIVRITTPGHTPAPVPTPTPTPTPAPTPKPTPTPSQTTGHKIYVTRTGKKYHYDPNCNGGTYYESTLQEALARGLTPCAKCVLN